MKGGIYILLACLGVLVHALGLIISLRYDGQLSREILKTNSAILCSLTIYIGVLLHTCNISLYGLFTSRAT